MGAPLKRWDPCIAHHGDDVRGFINEYFFSAPSTLLIAGAGFDPRAQIIPALFSHPAINVQGVFIREVRPSPSSEMVVRGEENALALSGLFPRHTVTDIHIFDSGNANVGGRNATTLIYEQSLEGVSDVVVDVSALSVGISFPVIRYLVEALSSRNPIPNLHVFVAHNPLLDGAIKPITGDTPGFVHGFRGRWGIDATASAVKLWMPQLAEGRVAALRRLYDFVGPHDTCPILPFPSINPRLGDALAEAFLNELENTWNVDARNIVYAAENDPLDLYRTILRLDERRASAFAEVGGSLLVLSPVGSKIMGLGALLAALERDLPIAYIEPVGYELKGNFPSSHSSVELLHLWLEGDVYRARAPLRTGVE